MNQSTRVWHVFWEPLGPYRTPDLGGGWPAETLFAALCHAVVMLWGKEVLHEIVGVDQGLEPAWQTTGGFPWVSGEPYWPWPASAAVNEAHGRTGWLSDAGWQEWNRGRVLDAEMVEESDARWREAFQPLIRPRVARDRTGGRGALFHTMSWSVKRGSGWHSLLRATGDGWMVLRPALQWLADTGLGGGRSSGYGQVGVTVEPYTRQDFDEGLDGVHELVTLTPFMPRPEELPLILNGARVRWREKRAWATSGSWSALTARYRVFEEGSTFRTVPVGRVVDIAPPDAPHPVWRDLRAWPVARQVGVPR
jgi:CRISPR type III-A-associated RAMP protein Csm4